MSEAIEAVLRGAGLSDKPGEYDSDIHSWRCTHPEIYGACDCYQELVRELAEVERKAAASAFAWGVHRTLEMTGQRAVPGDGLLTLIGNPYLAPVTEEGDKGA